MERFLSTNLRRRVNLDVNGIGHLQLKKEELESVDPSIRGE